MERDLTHCTHPDQKWCDCDWCRLLREQKKKDTRERSNRLTRIKVITGHAAHARFLAAVSEEPIGTIDRRPEIPSPYCFSSDHQVWDLDGAPIIIVETQHRRFEVFRVDGNITPPIERTK